MKSESRGEIMLHNRRKTQTQQLSPMENFTSQDTTSLEISNRAQAQFLRSSIFAINKVVGAFNRSRVNE